MGLPVEGMETMRAAVERGIDREGVLPGPLKLPRRAVTYLVRAQGYKSNLQSRGLVFAYALAVSEENASGGEIVTAPTCGSCGVLPAVLYHLQKSREFLRGTHTPRTRYRRTYRQRGETECIDIRRRGRLSGRGRCGVCHGCCRCQSAFRRLHGPDRICRGDGSGAPSRHDMRSGLRPGTDSLYRA